MITQLLVLADHVWTCPGCHAELESADLHGTSRESVIEHRDDCTVMAELARGIVDRKDRDLDDLRRENEFIRNQLAALEGVSPC